MDRARAMFNRQTAVKVLTALHLFEPVELALVRFAGVSLRSWAATHAAGVPYVPVLLLTTIGKETGELRSHPLFYIRDAGDYLVVASRGGSPIAPAWYGNLLANPQAWIHVKRRGVPVRASVLDEAERARVSPLFVAMWPAFAGYEERAAPRRMAVVRLRPLR